MILHVFLTSAVDRASFKVVVLLVVFTKKEGLWYSEDRNSLKTVLRQTSVGNASDVNSVREN